MPDRLILFTRYPEPGRAKTRLIPALGAAGAADLHRRLTEHTIAQMRALHQHRPLSLQVQFTGGSEAQMQAWLGAALDYQPQTAGDLGDRMRAALAAAFAAGSTRVVLIGSDCPDLDARQLDRAFRELSQHDLVLGPAADGGYYLIGLRQPQPALFGGIAWSTDRVCAQTRAIAQDLGLTIAELPVLSDVDRPQDLNGWERGSPQLSVIVPTLNESAHLAATLTLAQAAAQVELIVVDGGSTDDTLAIAERHPARVLRSDPGRARQMNAGAAVATGNLLLFLHADTHLPWGYDTWVRQLLAPPEVAAGAFELAIAGPQRSLRLVEWGVNWRSRWLHLPYGDQAIFLKADRFRASGGFADLPIMEDFDLMRRLRQQGTIAIAPVPVLTSGRRWQKLGVWRTTFINQQIILAYLLGVSPAQIDRWYRGERSKTR